MAEYRTIVGRTALLALIYCEDTLPSSIVCPDGCEHTPMCIHGLREGDTAVFDELLKEHLRADPKRDVETIEFRYWPFYEDFPAQSHNCISCYRNEEKGHGESHSIRDTDDVAKKLCEDCA